MLAIFMFAPLGALLLTTSSPIPDKAKARLGWVMWSAFECTIFAAFADKQEETKRLFNNGIKAGRDFLSALESGTISPEELGGTVPIGLTMISREGSPSADFIVGRVYDSSSDHATDKIIKEGSCWSASGYERLGNE